MFKHIFSLVIFFFILSIFIGSSLSLGIVYPLRVISPFLMFGLMFFFYEKKLLLSFLNKQFLWFVLTFFIFSLVSSITGYLSFFILPKLDDTLNFLMVFILIINLTLIYLFDKKMFLKRINISLKIIYLLFVLVALYELFTFNHLPISRHYGNVINIPTGFFYNENDFAAIFTLIFLFLFTQNKLKLNFFTGFICVIHFAILVFVGARISCFVLLMFFVIFRFRSTLIVSLMALFFLIFSNQNFVNKFDADFFLNKVLVKKNDGSKNVRLNLYKESLKSVKGSFGFGYGINSSTSYFKTIGQNSNIGSVKQPHSFQLELLLNSGVVVFAFFIILNLYVFYVLMKINQFERAFHIFSYNLILFSSSSSLYIWSIYLFLFIYICWADEKIINLDCID